MFVALLLLSFMVEANALYPVETEHDVHDR
jgi:hypothetical protein